MKDVISVVIPVYKVEQYLRTCVDSVLNQTYKNLQVILVDDGSPDNCPQICDEYAERDNRVRVIHKKNGGLSDARNAGIEIALGKYITFVDSDDFVFPGMIARLYELCEKYHADFSMCQCIRKNDKDILNYIQYRMDSGEIVTEKFENKEKMRAYLVSHKIDVTAWKKLYDVKLFQSVRFPKGKLHEDTFITYLLIDNANKVVVTNEVGYIYRNNPQSIMNSEFTIKRLHLVEAKLEQLKYIEEKYPQLRKYACAEVIYACNCCIKGMALKGYFEKETERKIQLLYRKYTMMYLKVGNVSVKGKILALFAFLNTRFVKLGVKAWYLLYSRLKEANFL